MRPVSPADGYDAATLRRLCAEGALVWVAGEVYLPVDVAGTAQARREALALLVPRGATVTMGTAVWCRGGPGLPWAAGPQEDPSRPRIELLVRTGSSPRSLPPLVRTRQCDVAADQVELLGPLRVATGARTAVDLARWGEGPQDDEALVWLWESGVTLRQAGAVLRRQRRTPGVRRARTVLSAVRQGHPHPLRSKGLDGPQPVRLPVTR